MGLKKKNSFQHFLWVSIILLTIYIIGPDGFFEWYTIDGQPKGSGIFRGSAGVLLEAMEAIQQGMEGQ